MRRRPTITDVAREAGVSVGTVSHVLNRSAKVRPATRARVEAAIDRLSYRPNALARSLIASRARGEDPGLRVRPRLVTLGYISVDYIARVAVLPHRDDRVTASGIEKALGGPAANVAVAAAALGEPFAMEVDLATAIGDDSDSEWALAELARKGVQALPIRRPPNNRLSRCFVIVEANGARTIVNEPLEVTGADLLPHLPIEPQDRASCLHVEGFHIEKVAGSIGRLREAGWTISLQTTGLPASLCERESFTEIARNVDIIFVNTTTARMILGSRPGNAALIEDLANFRREAELGATIVLTLGAEGAAVIGAQTLAAVPALAVDVVDLTGAGDAFAGAYLAYWLHGADILTAARRAAIAGSLSVSAEGAQGFSPSHADIAAREKAAR